MKPRSPQRIWVTVLCVSIVALVIICAALPLAARIPLLRHRLWEIEIGRMGLWMGEPIDAFKRPVPLVRAENGDPYIYLRTAIPLQEPGHYWFTGIKWNKRERNGSQ